ncbi:MAG: transcription termination/antitermination protein NusG [Acidimicrobiia bacterium]|nr:transcription termination/antitermination protein NusG [Acidimicrobiia bacterium]
MADTVEVTEEPTVDVSDAPESEEVEVAVEATETVVGDPAPDADEAEAESEAPEAASEPEAEPEPEVAAEGGAEPGVAAEPQAEAEAEGVAEPSEEPVEPAAPKVVSPYDLPGDWYVIHSYSGYENKVKVNLETRINSMHMEDRIFEVHIPMEDVVEFKNGKKTTVNKKVFPGYILVRMTLDDDSWYAVRNTPGVTGFVAGNAQKPTPLSRREVERFLGVQKEEEKGKPRFKPDWEIGEQVRVVTGPFADFNGVIEEINVDQQKIVVLVNIFGRDTPVELGFDDIQKN